MTGEIKTYTVTLSEEIDAHNIDEAIIEFRKMANELEASLFDVKEVN